MHPEVLCHFTRPDHTGAAGDPPALSANEAERSEARTTPSQASRAL